MKPSGARLSGSCSHFFPGLQLETWPGEPDTPLSDAAQALPDRATES